MLAARPRSGYEIKQLVDNSARFFWAASYGQIYPELKRLEDAGLISGRDASQGARQRTVFKLTAKGRRAAEEWIERRAAGLRAPRRGAAGALLRRLDRAGADRRDRARAGREGGRDRGRASRRCRTRSSGRHEAEGAEYSPDPGSLTVLRYGIEMNEWAAEWFERAAEDLENEISAAARSRAAREVEMFNALASLAQRHGKRTVIFAAVFFVIAGALGGGVASKLAPYGADDPATESVKASDRLEADGYRDPSVIVLFQNTSPTSQAGRAEDPAGRAPAAGRTRTSRGSPATSRPRARDFVSRDGNATYLAVSLKPTDDKDEQDAAKQIADDLEGQPGVTVGGIALAQEQVNKQVEKDLRKAEMLAFPLLFLLSLLFFRSVVAALLPLMIGGLAIVGTFLLLRVASEFVVVSIFALNLTTGLGLGLAIDYSLFVVSRYREEIAKSGPGAEAMRRTLNTAGRTVLFSSITVAVGARLAAGLPAALPLLDGARRRAGRAARRRDLADGAAGGAGAARQPGQRLVAELPAAPRRARRDRHRAGLLVPALPLRHAPADRDRDRDRRGPDRARHPVLLDQVHLGRRAGAARERQRPAGRQRDAGAVPALPRHAEPAAGGERDAVGAARGRARGLAR